MDSGKSDSDQDWSWEESLKSAIHLNIPLSTYEEMTPYELCLYAEVYQEKFQANLEEELTKVWLGEYYHRLKRLPSLKSELDKFNQPEKPKMSDDEMLRVVQILNKQLKGTTIE